VRCGHAETEAREVDLEWRATPSLEIERFPAAWLIASSQWWQSFEAFSGCTIPDLSLQRLHSWIGTLLEFFKDFLCLFRGHFARVDFAFLQQAGAGQQIVLGVAVGLDLPERQSPSENTL
jgi:hypothetical protein